MTTRLIDISPATSPTRGPNACWGPPWGIPPLGARGADSPKPVDPIVDRLDAIVRAIDRLTEAVKSR